MLVGFKVLLSAALVGVAVTTSTWSDNVATPMGKVVELLAKLQQQVEQDGIQDAKIFSANHKWYLNETEFANKTIKETTATIQELKSVIAEAKAFQEKANVERMDTANGIAKAENDLKNATQIREKERSDFKKSDLSLLEAIDELKRSLEVLSKSAPAASLAQSTQDASFLSTETHDTKPHELTGVATRLVKTLSHSFDLRLSEQQRGILDEFVRYAIAAGDQSEASFLQTRVHRSDGPYGSYGKQSGGVNDLLQKLLEESQQNKDDGMKQEKKSQEAFKKFKDALLKEIDDKNQAFNELSMQIAESEQLVGVKSSDLKTAQGLLSATQKRLAEVQAMHRQRTLDYKARIDKRTDELLALRKATSLLTSQAAKRFAKKQSIGEIEPEQSLIQLSRGTHSVVCDNARSSRRMALKLVRGAETPQVALLALRTQTQVMATGRYDPFVKVRRMIQGLLKKLLDEAAEEATHKAWCDTELAQSAKSKAEKEHDIGKLQNRIEAMEAEVAQLTDEIDQTQSDINDMMTSLKAATEVRNKESAKNKAAIVEYADAQELVQEAINVLKDFYDAESRPDAHEHTGKGKWEGSTAADGNYKAGTNRSEGVIGMLEVARDDFKRLEEETKKAESDAQADFEELKNESEVKMAVFTTNLEHKSRKKISIKRQLVSAKNELSGYQAELKAVLGYIEKLQKPCVTGGLSYEDRARRREEELASLKDALAVLNGDAIAA